MFLGGGSKFTAEIRAGGGWESAPSPNYATCWGFSGIKPVFILYFILFLKICLFQEKLLQLNASLKKNLSHMKRGAASR